MPPTRTIIPPFAEPAEASTYDALAELFLGDGPVEADTKPKGREASARPSPVPAPPPSDSLPTPASARGGPAVELLVMGHLPVRSNPWAAQYARAAGDRLGHPVALIRLGAGEASVDLFGLPPTDRERQGRPTIDAAITLAARAAGTVVLQVEAPDEGALTGLHGLTAVTLLCAANEAAEVAAYQAIKSLAESFPAVSPSSPVLQLGVMGAESERSAALGERLGRTARLFLKREVRPVASVAKMGPTGGAPVFRGFCALDAAAVVQRLREASRHHEPAPRAAREAAPFGSVAVQQAGDGAKQGVPTMTAELRQQVGVPASLVPRVPGLRALAFRCPDDASVEFAVDGAGGLHLLRSGDDPEGVRSLTTAGAWAVKNAGVLSLAVPGLAIPITPTPHLFTAAPKTVRPLLDSSVRVHLLASVEVEGKAGWYCAELN